MYVYIELDGILPDKEVELQGDVITVDNGIGSYEFWGARGVDHNYEPELQDVTWEEREFTEEENKLIKSYVDKEWESLDQQFCEKYDPQDEAEEQADIAYDRWKDEQHYNNL